MSDVAFTLPDELLNEIAERAAAIVLERSNNGAWSEPVWLTLDQAADRLACTRDAVRMRAKRGRLETKRHGRRVYVSRASVDGVK